MTVDYAEKLREIAKSDEDPARRREAARRLHERGESVEGRPMREVLTEKVADSKARTAHYENEEAQPPNRLRALIQGADKNRTGPFAPALAAADIGDRVGTALGAGVSSLAGMSALMGRISGSNEDPTLEPPAPPPPPARFTPLPQPAPIPDEEPTYPALDALIAKHVAAAQQPAHDPVVVDTVARSSVADKLAVARTADRVKQIERVEKLRTKRPKRHDHMTTVDPITGEEL